MQDFEMKKTLLILLIIFIFVTIVITLAIKGSNFLGYYLGREYILDSNLIEKIVRKDDINVNNLNDCIFISNGPNQNLAYILSKYKIEFFIIKTTDNPNGFMNMCFAAVNEKKVLSPEKVYLYKIGMIEKPLKYSKEIMVKFADYNEDNPYEKIKERYHIIKKSDL